MRFAHTMIRVGDLERSVRFYTEMLGFREVRRREVPEGRFTLVFLEPPAGNAQLELTYNWDRSHYDLGDGFGHIALAVAHPGETYEELVRRGVPRFRPFNGRYAFVRDPDGYAIELVFDRSGSESAP